MTDTTHTPTPWNVDEYKSIVDSEGNTISANGFAMVMSYGEEQKKAQANAAHIVKCVNMHDELVKALKNAREELEEYESSLNHENYNNPSLNEVLKKVGAL